MAFYVCWSFNLVPWENRDSLSFQRKANLVDKIKVWRKSTKGRHNYGQMLMQRTMVNKHKTILVRHHSSIRRLAYSRGVVSKPFAELNDFSRLFRHWTVQILIKLFQRSFIKIRTVQYTLDTHDSPS